MCDVSEEHIENGFFQEIILLVDDRVILKIWRKVAASTKGENLKKDNFVFIRDLDNGYLHNIILRWAN